MRIAVWVDSGIDARSFDSSEGLSPDDAAGLYNARGKPWSGLWHQWSGNATRTARCAGVTSILVELPIAYDVR